MGNYKEQLINTGLGIGESLISGLGLDYFAKESQLKQARKFNAMNLDQFNKMQQMGNKYQLDLWQSTSYPAQMEMLKKAGLNPALMYGSAGGGGTTGSTVSPGSSGNAQEMSGLGIQMAMQMRMNNAQIDLLKAQAEESRANANATVGYKANEAEARTEQIKADTIKIFADTEFTKAKTVVEGYNAKIAEINANIAKDTQDIIIEKLTTETKIAWEQLQSLKRENKFSTEVYEHKVKQFQQQTLLNNLDILLKKEQINLTSEQVKKVSAEISETIYNVRAKYKDLDLKQQFVEIQKELMKNNTIKTEFDTGTGAQVERVVRVLNGVANIAKAISD